jgi:LysM repeat protein
LGAHAKPSKMKVVPQAATAAAAAPTVAGVAAAICLSPQAPAQAATVPATHTAQRSSNTAIVPAAYRKAPTPAQLLSASRKAAKQKLAAKIPATYTVRSGDTLSSIAGRIYKNPNAWPVLYWANHHKLKWADVINVGQVLKVPSDASRVPAAPKQLSPVRYVPKHAAPQPTATAQSSEQAPTQTTTTADYSGTYPGGAFGACVVARESGGNPDIWNASGHWGLYQFSESTWVAYGGAAADFGSASVAEQNAVFATALAQGGQDNWAPYDGC